MILLGNLRGDVRAAGTSPAMLHTEETKGKAMATREPDRGQPQEFEGSTGPGRDRAHPVQRPEARPPRRAGRPAGREPRGVRGRNAGVVRRLEARTHTRAVLVERAAVASWKLRRATRVETARLYETAADAAHEFDLAQKERVEGALHRLAWEPGAALAHLRCDAAGLDRLIGLWEELAVAASDPAGWNSRTDHHDRLLNLLGHPTGSDPKDLEIARTSLGAARRRPTRPPRRGCAPSARGSRSFVGSGRISGTRR